MNRDELLQLFKGQISGKNFDKGYRVFNNDLVEEANIKDEGSIFNIKAKVISESLFNEYKTEIEIDKEDKNIISTYCSCMDFEKNEFSKENYCCKHLMATIYKTLDELVKFPAFNKENILKTYKVNKGADVLSILLGDGENKEELKIEVYINKNQWDNRIYFELKIGLASMSSNSLYVLKDIGKFLVAIYNNIPISYGKNLTLNMKEQKLGVKDKRLIDFIQMLINMDGSNVYHSKIRKPFIDGKYVHVPDYLVREFFQVIKKHRVYLNEGFTFRTIETEIVEGAPNIAFDLKNIKDEYVLKAPGGMPTVLGSRNNVFLYGITIYLPSYEYCEKLEAYFKVFNDAKVVTLPSSKEDTVLRKLIPNLNFISQNVNLDKKIKEKVVEAECEFKFYFDKDGKDITLTTKVKYGAYEFNIFEDCSEKVIYRSAKKELEVLEVIRALGFQEVKGKFYLSFGDDYIFRFFKTEIERLQKLGEVFYSERFKGIKALGTKGIAGDIKTGKYNYFELDFKLGDIPPTETTAILRAFRDNLKYFKLKNGEYLDLEEMELRNFLKLLDSVSPKAVKNNHIEIPKNRAYYLDKYFEDNNIRYIKGKTELKKVTNKLKNIEKLDFKEPKNLNGSLRKYQKVGYNWFKTLDYLGFGGILGDEMGLGKTFQTIAFLLSNEGSKTLIVVPTSLVYNWIQEFEKFAPSMKVIAGNGPKNDREKIIKNIEGYDVIVTTYNLVKRDLEIYKSLEFDYCILDEAQNIKNPHSQNALSIKKLNTKTRFALSGTPIENSVLELWSIFDFIMPGYLYDEKRFSVRYYKKLKEEPEVIEDLNRLIKPFILRRKKKEVALELPDKIENIMMVDFEDKQKKVYATYAKHAQDLIKKKVENDEFKNSKIEILAYITRLRQLCLDPSVVMEEYTGSSAKIEALSELLNDSVSEGHRVLVFSQFTSVLSNIAKRISLDGITYSYLDGSVPSQKRMEMTKKFNEGENSVFLISLKAGGTGLNLTSADVVVHFDPWWNPAVEDQATDRAHRIGQKNVVQVIKIVAKGTIEEKIILLQKEKKKLIENLLGDELSNGENLAALTEEEILKLFV
ncbi:DEAD/DEAH box helicase [Clostridium hydrogenum]|uniref:DEAD/DEAH box helicase n=1 Tax=Clostridium hydrogenum TaxID=2855764 RepID=UPI001F32F8B8|nr:DEAD/DEAH box helicase [Clostridium hydrogenum]